MGARSSVRRSRAPRAAFARELIGRRPRSCGSTMPNFMRWRATRHRAMRSRLMRAPQASSSALSGETDLVADGERIVALANGHP